MRDRDYRAEVEALAASYAAAKTDGERAAIMLAHRADLRLEHVEALLGLLVEARADP